MQKIKELKKELSDAKDWEREQKDKMRSIKDVIRTQKIKITNKMLCDMLCISEEIVLRTGMSYNGVPYLFEFNNTFAFARLVLKSPVSDTKIECATLFYGEPFEVLEAYEEDFYYMYYTWESQMEVMKLYASESLRDEIDHIKGNVEKEWGAIKEEFVKVFGAEYKED